MKNLLLLSAGLGITILLNACTPQTPQTPTPPSTETSRPADAQQPLAKRKIIMTSGNVETLDATLEKLMGTWHSMPENFSDESKAWMKENHITGYYNSFSWGTNKAWIDFGDFRVADGKAEKTGVGIISWHTGFKHLRFRESGARGGLVDGMIEIKDENTFVRHYEFFTPKGEVKYRSDSWAFDPATLDCFIWQTTAYKGAEPVEYPGRKYCKR